VIPGEDGKFIQPSNQIPPGCDISGDEDTKGQNREGVHESAAMAGALLGREGPPQLNDLGSR
jgi:hypothetical protein